MAGYGRREETASSVSNDGCLRRALKATSEQLKRTRAELYKGPSKITSANSKGVSEKVASLASTTPEGGGCGRKEHV